ncbi:hypothetical protein BC629DRAFT_1037396 [Irpex lacteus]|nr:hypothetical protein BC629DRAFT_1037396 [Irpex lacteus]
MVTVNVNSPHPLIKEPILYVVDPPAHLERGHLTATFRGYGAISLISKDEVPSDPSRKTWGIRFSSIHYAEMALATLHGHLVKTAYPIWILMLSHSPTAEEDSDMVFDRPFPQYMKMEPDSCLGDAFDMRSAFRCLRTAGPLVSVRVDVDVGEQQRTIVVQYFKEEHANFARQMGNALHKRLRQCKFTLQSFDPCSLHCSGFGPDFVLKDLVDTFSQFSDISSATLKQAGEPDVHGIVTFGSPTDAAQALQEINGKVLQTGTLAVRYADPEARRIFYLPAPPAASPGHDVENASIPDPDVPCPTPEQAAEAKENKLKALRTRREDLERLLSQAKNELDAARSDAHNASQEYDSAQQAQKLADEEVEIAKRACAEAYRIWLEAKEREAATIRQASCAQDATGAALLRKQQADTRIWEVEQLQESTLAQKAELDRELAEDDERRHQAELAESVRRMREMREVEERERRERVRKEREAEAERQRRLREEEERLEREKREEARRKQEAEAYRLKIREAAERAAREEREKALKKQKAEEDRLWRQRQEAERIAREELEKAALKKQKDEQGWIGWVGEKARQARDEAERIARELREYEEKRRKDEEDRLRRKREQDQQFERRVEESWEQVLKWRKAEERRKREEAERVAREQREEALKKQKAEEERQKRQREEAERVAREQRKKEEAERRAAEARQRLYDEALAKEIELRPGPMVRRSSLDIRERPVACARAP